MVLKRVKVLKKSTEPKAGSFTNVNKISKHLARLKIAEKKTEIISFTKEIKSLLLILWILK